MKERLSFVVYKEWRDVVDTMNAEQSQQFLQAMFAYQDGEDIDEIITDPSVKMVFALIKKQFDRDAEKYDDTCQKRSEWGKKGAEARQKTLAKAKNESSNLAGAKNDLANLAGAKNDLANLAEAKNDLANLANAKNDLANLADNDNEDDNDNDNDNDLKEKAPKGAKEKSTKRFSAPSVEQVKEYCRERGNQVDPEQFIAFYESKGWMVGQNHMKDWKAAVRTWEKRDTRAAPKVRPYQGKPNKFNNFEQRKYEYSDLERRLLNS